MPASGPRSGRAGPMGDVVYLIMRRMRAPLLVLVLVFTVCTVGLAWMPGVDASGHPTKPMGLFDAFYVISYTATTIGFGEIPAPYSTLQRMWMTGSIYLTVIAWYYALVTTLALVQDHAFQTALRMGRFSSRIHHLREPFYIVCGAGETGSLVCRGLDRLGCRFVVIDHDDARLQQIRLDDYHADVPMIAADAGQPSILQEAGLLSPFCKGVIAVVNDDAVNQGIAVTTRLLAPKVAVLARIRDAETETHVGVFGGDLVINPFDRFAEHLGAAVSAPQRYRLREILTGLEDDPLPPTHRPPRGHWIMCGYGRFGHAVAEELREAGNTVSIIDQRHFEEHEVDVFGTGTDSESLEAAGLADAVGIVAGNATDTKNLAIAVTARDLKPTIFIVTRQNQNANTPLFDAFEEDLTMVPSKIVAQEFLARITTPQLVRYLNRLPFHDERQCGALCARLEQVNQGRIPVIWSQRIDAAQAEGVMAYLADGGTLTLGQLRQGVSPTDPPLGFVVLLVSRSSGTVEEPDDRVAVRAGDEILFAGSTMDQRWVDVRMHNINALTFVTQPFPGSGGTLWRWVSRRWRRRHGGEADPEPTPEPAAEPAPSDDADDDFL